MRFDVCAHTYDEHAGPQRFFAERVAQFIRSRTGILPVQLDSHPLRDSQIAGASPDRQDARPTTVLELGAGTGALTLCLAGAPSTASARPSEVFLQSKAVLGAPILATDASLAMVKCGCLAAPQAQWSVLDAFREPLPTAALQVSSGLLHWAEDPAAVLRRWKTHLTPGGRMVHAIPCEPCLAEWRALVPESPVPWRNEPEWRKVFERAGLRVTRSQSWTHVTVCSSALEMVRGFHHTGVTGRTRIGPARLRQALREYDAKHHVAGGVEATWAWLAVEAA